MIRDDAEERRGENGRSVTSRDQVDWDDEAKVDRADLGFLAQYVAYTLYPEPATPVPSP